MLPKTRLFDLHFRHNNFLFNFIYGDVIRRKVQLFVLKDVYFVSFLQVGEVYSSFYRRQYIS